MPRRPIDDSKPSKYCALATCTVLFYDHLLTLADEVCPYSSCDCLLSSRFVEDQICLVWKEIVECANRLKRMISPADVWAAFWLFIAVGLVFRFEVSFFSDQLFQNRYFPMAYQIWQLAGWCLISLPGLWEYTNHCTPNHSDIQSAITIGHKCELCSSQIFTKVLLTTGPLYPLYARCMECN